MHLPVASQLTLPCAGGVTMLTEAGSTVPPVAVSLPVTVVLTVVLAVVLAVSLTGVMVAARAGVVAHALAEPVLGEDVTARPLICVTVAVAALYRPLPGALAHALDALVPVTVKVTVTKYVSVAPLATVTPDANGQEPEPDRVCAPPPFLVKLALLIVVLLLKPGVSVRLYVTPTALVLLSALI